MSFFLVPQTEIIPFADPTTNAQSKSKSSKAATRQPASFDDASKTTMLDRFVKRTRVDNEIGEDYGGEGDVVMNEDGTMSYALPRTTAIIGDSEES